MTTTTGELRRLDDVADVALRTGARARATLAVALPATVAFLALGARIDSFPAGFVYAWVWLAALVVGVYTLIHGYHFGHREGRRSAWSLVVLTGGWAALVVWVAVAATGGRGAGRPSSSA